MKLEVGMYLRHEGLEGSYPIIQKITRIETPGRAGGKYKVFTNKCGDWFIDSDYIKLNKSKYSFDILDLVEVGDYVNGKKVTKINTKAPITGHKAIEYCDTLYGHKTTYIYKSKDIKTVVTHEAYEKNSYDVEKEG